MAYKMKGSEYFGKGEKSPFKVSDEAIVAAQNKLDKTELDFREPGWAKAAKQVFAAPTEKGGKTKSGGDSGAKGADAAKADLTEDSESVQDVANKNSSIDV